ncbi:MAG: hypothetical protein PHG05_01160 [Candidatus Nanoarchaeia archaeon]|nr:hypothetical protein [Candidatus Nanoarchaeia archaeon]
MEITKKEVKAILIASFLIALVFGFNDGSDLFEIQHWILNFLFIFLGAVLSTFIYTFVIKLGAIHYGGKATYRMWTIKQIFIRQQMRFEPPIPIGAIIGFLFTLFSNGKLFLLAIHSPEVVSDKVARTGRLFKNIYETEIAKVHALGPLTLLALGLLLNVINPVLFDRLITMNYLLAIYHLIPFSDLNGTHLFMGARLLYVFIVILVIGCVILAQFLSPIQSVIVALVIALILGGWLLFAALGRK